MKTLYLIFISVLAISISSIFLIITGAKKSEIQLKFRRMIRIMFYGIGVFLMVYCTHLLMKGTKLEENLKIKKNEIETLKSKNDSLNIELEKTTVELRLIKDKEEDYKERIDELNTLNVSSNSKLEKLKIKYSEEYISLIKEYSEKSKKANILYLKLEETTNNLHNKIDSLTDSNDKLKSDFAETRLQLKKSRINNDRLNNMIKALDLERLGDHSRSKEDKRKYYENAVFFLNKGSYNISLPSFARINNKYEKHK